MNVDRGVADTSVFIAAETGRPLDHKAMPYELAVSFVTIAELQAGVLAAPDTATRARRLATLDLVNELFLLAGDDRVAAEWARLRVHLAEAGRHVNVNDLWVAATAAAHDLPVVTQDDDFDPLADVVDVLRV